MAKITKEFKDFLKHTKRMATPSAKKQRIRFAIASHKAKKK